jgi:hypothetical protein
MGPLLAPKDHHELLMLLGVAVLPVDARVLGELAVVGHLGFAGDGHLRYRPVSPKPMPSAALDIDTPEDLASLQPP